MPSSRRTGFVDRRGLPARCRFTTSRCRLSSARGSLLIDLLLAAAVTGIVLAIGLPVVSRALQSYRLVGSARAVAHELALARMEAAAQFTRARLAASLSDGTFQVEVCTVKGPTACTTFTPQGRPRYLASGTQFGHGSISVPAGTQPNVAQTASITVNSRGIPVDSSGAPTGAYALYLTNGAGEYSAVTISASSRVAVWQYHDGAWVSQ